MDIQFGRLIRFEPCLPPRPADAWPPDALPAAARTAPERSWWDVGRLSRSEEEEEEEEKKKKRKRKHEMTENYNHQKH